MEFLNSFIQAYGMEIIMAIFTFIAGFIGTKMKLSFDRKINAENEKINEETKRKVVSDTCKYVEQIYKDLKGEEKLLKAISSATEMLNEKGIQITDLELRVLIESTVNSFKKELKGE